MTKAEFDIVNALLNKYEASAHLKNPGQSGRRVLLNIAKKGFPDYEYHDLRVREAYNQAILNLARQRIINVTWLNNKSNTVAKEIWLDLENVAAAYALAGCLTPQQKAHRIAALYTGAAGKVKAPWMRDYFLQHAEQLERTLRLLPVHKKGAEHIEKLLTAHIALDGLREGISMRAFSILCYSDSKLFEREIRDDFLRDCSAICPAILEQPEQDELSWQEKLHLLDIFVWPEYYELAGNVVIHAKDGQCNLGALAGMGVALPSHTLWNNMRLTFDEVEHIIFIENKTCYDEYVLKHRGSSQLAVFHGGFSSAGKRKFFQNLYSSAKRGTTCAYWGDIDLGGFYMYAQLRQIIPDLQPWLMDGQVVERFSQNGLQRSEAYLMRMEQALQNSEFIKFHDAIIKILHFGVTIEQEILLPYMNELA